MRKEREVKQQNREWDKTEIKRGEMVLGKRSKKRKKIIKKTRERKRTSGRKRKIEK